jgi:LRR receptor-like serine/threonine-protein kinase FLS2
LSFRRAITADPRGLLSNWTAQNSANICSWYGILCRKHSRRVAAIDLRGSGLEGTLSPSLGNLSLLHSLDLLGNKLTGGIPPEFRQLKALRRLDLSKNLLSGSIPVELGMLQRLEELYLDVGRYPW